MVDSQRWTGFALLASFNDIFFMALMFFLSGLFVWKSLQRKGSAYFLRDRALRLGCRSSSRQQWWRPSPTIRPICKLGPGADSRARGSSGGR